MGLRPVLVNPPTLVRTWGTQTELDLPSHLFRLLQNCHPEQVSCLRQVKDEFIPSTDPRVPHISLVFGEMWDTATVS